MGNKYLLYGRQFAQETQDAMSEAKRRSIYSFIPPISRASAEDLPAAITETERPKPAEIAAVETPESVTLDAEKRQVPEAPKIQAPKPSVRRLAGEILGDPDITPMRKKERLRNLGREYSAEGDRRIIEEAIKNVR